MISFVLKHPFLLLCAYGIVWTGAFHVLETERPNKWVFLAYFLGLLGLWASALASAAANFEGSLFGLVYYLALGTMILVCNILPVRHLLEFVLGQTARELTGLNQINVRKSYDHATGAESRGDLDTAARLYREEIQKDPDDTEARRHLAEVLARAGKPQEATDELRALIERIGDGEQACQVMFRLAEVTDELLHDGAEAVRIYERLIRKYPKDKLAEYARLRLHGRETTNGHG